jgi:hypothetical protein
MSSLKQIKFSLTQRQLDFLERESTRSGISLGEALRRVLDQFLDQQPRQRRKK